MSRPVKRRSKTGCLAMLALLLLAAGLVAAAAGLLLRAVRQPAGLALVVQLRSPSPGEQAELNRPLDVEALAHSLAGVTRLELYADGALAGAQHSSLPTGSNPLLYLQPWTPLSIGRHALVARAYDNTGLFSDSDVVYVDVIGLIQTTERLTTDALAASPGGPLPSLNDVAAGLKVSVQQLLDLNPGLQDGNTAAPLPRGTSLTLPRTIAPAPATTPAPALISGSPPAPGGLTATLNCATAQISWAAVNGVSQYAVYRLGPSDSAPQRAVMNGTAYSDALVGLGEYRYQVASVLGGLETLSPMVIAATPGTCVPPALALGTVDVHLTALALDTVAVFDGVYCYLSVDGSPFERVPRADFSFLLPGAGGLHYDLPAQLPNRGHFLLASHARAAPVRLTGDCWGQAGALSLSLGAFTTENPPTEWNGAQRESWLRPAGANVAFRLGGHLGSSAPARAGGGARLSYTLDAAQSGAPAGLGQSVADQRLLEAFGLPAPQNLRIENSIQACDELAHEAQRRYGPGDPRRLPSSDSKNDPLSWLTEPLRQSLAEQTLCMASRAFGGAPTLLWDWHDDAGHFTEASLVGYHVVANLTDLERPRPTDFILRPFRLESVAEGIYWQRDIRPGTRKATLARITDLPCGVRMDFTATAVYAGAQSAPSDVFSFETEPCSNAATVTVDIDTLVVGPVNDQGDLCPLLCSTNILEVIGYLFAGSGRWDSRRQWISDLGETRLVERHEGGAVVGNTEVIRPPNALNLTRQGSYQWSDQWLANSEAGRLQGIWRQHKRWWFVARPNQTIPIGVRLDDWDGLSVQPFCYTDYEIPARRATVWFTTDETFSMRDTRGEASCEISVHVVGARIDYSAHP